MSHLVTLKHNFETAHRLPHLGGKCQSLHGHSWWTEVTLSAPALSEDLTVVEFGAFKKAMRAWIDDNLDHGAMLGLMDPLVPLLEGLGCKVFVFGQDWDGARWPTVEAVAQLLADQAAIWIGQLPEAAPDVQVAGVKVTETAVNCAEWRAE